LGALAARESSSSAKRLPSLDGLRAISAAMVVPGHTEKLLKIGSHLLFEAGVIDVWGPVGVTVFFVISGFLITRLLIAEQDQTGSINLCRFYVRRGLRILPAYWFYLSAVLALTCAGAVVAGRAGFAHALSFTTDYVNPQSWVLNHSWSLSVEEQFYALWPLLLLILGAARARRTALFLVIAAPFARVLTYFCAPQLRPAITSMLHLRIDALMIGCWVALEQRSNPSSRFLRMLEQPRTAACAAAYCALIAGIVRHVGFANVAFGYTLEELSACSLVLWALRYPSSNAGRVLNSGPLVHVGSISYSLYLWQQLWLTHERSTPVWQVPLLVIGTLVSAEASYWFIERPMLRLRSRLSFAVSSPNAAPTGTSGASCDTMAA